MEYSHGEQAINLELTCSPEQSLIHPDNAARAIVFSIHVPRDLSRAGMSQRPPLSLALVLDRSGSMQGAKLQTAKQAALAALDQLTPRDTVSLVVFDSQIDTIQAAAPVTPQLKSQVRETLHTLQARASTALHEGWLTGCNSITSEGGKAPEGLARCFLLTDGIANVGVTDPERIASEAAGIREHTGISTSTFGIGSDYNELLLGPMAVAGGGQFHHLREPEEIINTFVGELGGLLSVAATRVRLEVETTRGTELDLVSPYWMRPASDNPLRRVISIGDLQGDETRPVVVRCTFPGQEGREPRVVRARLTWRIDGGERATEWQELRFSYASAEACASELRDPRVLEEVARHEADRARREVVASNNRGDMAGAQQQLQKAIGRVSSYSASPGAQSELTSLQGLAAQVAAAPMAPAMAKELYYSQQRRSRNEADYRQAPPPTPPEAAGSTDAQAQPPDQSRKEPRGVKLPWQSAKKDRKPPREQ